MNKFKYDSIDEYQLEITSHCNAACPQCPRNNNGSGVNPYLPLSHLSKDVIKKAFSTELVGRIRQIFFCGSYGDPIAHPHFLDILQDFRDKNPQVWLYLHTNGGIRSEQYWSDMGKIIGNHGQIDFGLDGLSDTLHIYRKNVKYTKAIANATAFIKAGGRAQWNFIVFKHNEHQVDDVLRIGKDLGFFNVLIRKTGRFFNHGTLEEMDKWPVTGQPIFFLEPPVNRNFRNPSLLNLPALKQEYTNIADYFNTTEIQCDAARGKKVAINAEGLVLPCNFFNHNLHDARYYNSSVLPGAHALSSENGKNKVRTFLEGYGLDNLNIKYHSIEEIFNNQMWSDLSSSFGKTFENGRLFECAMTCGSKFKKVWDQQQRESK